MRGQTKSAPTRCADGRVGTAWIESWCARRIPVRVRSGPFLRFPDLTGLRLDGVHRIARVDDAMAPAREFLVVHVRMIGREQDRVETGDGFPIPGDGLRAGPLR